MTREEAIAILIHERDEDLFMRTEYRKRIHEALTMGIKALKQKPSEDAISRQAVINTIANICFWLSADNWEELIKCINSIPSVTPQYTDAEIQKMQELEQAEIEKAYELGKAQQPKTGHWIKEEKEFIVPSRFYPIQEIVSTCSICNAHYTGMHGDFKYCPNCGAKMAESENT